MTTFNTGNPVPSTDGRDLSDNAESIDEFVSGTTLTTTTRTGKSVLTRKGVEAQYVFTAINNGVWAAGQSFTAVNQFMVFSGTAYKPKNSTTLPYVVGATPVGDANVEVVANLSTAQADARYTREFDTVASAVAATELVSGLTITTRDNKTAGDGGGAKYLVKTAAQAATDGDVIDELGGHTLLNALVIAIQTIGGRCNITQYGAVGNVGGAVDDLPSTTAAMLSGNKTVVVPNKKHGVLNTVLVPTGINLIKEGDGGFVALGILSPLEVILTPDTDATDINIGGLSLDGDNQPGVSGFFTRKGCKRIKVNGLDIKNLAHDLARQGGRAVSVHGGAPNGNEEITIDNTTIAGCYQALDTVFDDAGNANRNIVISNTTVKNVEILIGTFSANGNFPLPAGEQSVVINGVVATNVGRSDTYTRAHGIINSQQGGNLLIDNVYITNDAAYTAVKKVYAVMGKMSNVTIGKMVINGQVDYVYNNSAWDESDAPASNDLVSRDLDFNINVVGQAFSPVFSNLTAGSAATLIRSTLKMKANSWVQANVFDFAVDKYTTVYSEIMESTFPRRLTGMMSSLNSIPFTTTGANTGIDINGALLLVDTVDGKTYRALLSSGVLGAFAILN